MMVSLHIRYIYTRILIIQAYSFYSQIGTGFSDEQLVTFTKELKEVVCSGPKKYYRAEASEKPDVWFEPHFVWEVKAADLSLSPAHYAAIGLVRSAS